MADDTTPTDFVHVTNPVSSSAVAQGSTTSGQTGTLVQGAVTTAAPTYTTGQTDPVSLDTAGGLRIAGNQAQGATTASAVGILTYAASSTAAPSYGNNQMRPLSMDVAGNLRNTGHAAVEGGGTFTHVAAGQATTTIKSGAGTLYAILFGGAATATNVTIIYDNTAGSGTVIWVPSTTAIVGPNAVQFGPYGLAFATGLTVVTATANGPDMTFVWK